MTQDNLKELYYKIKRNFGTSKELVSVNYTAYADNYLDMAADGLNLFRDLIDADIYERKHNEFHFHNFLKHQLFSRLQEIKYYSDVNIMDTRRLIAVSPDCISSIQVLIRDSIHVNVYFRSSDFDGALPVDLDFLSEIPSNLINHLMIMQGKPGYEEVNDDIINTLKQKRIKLNLSFGSLHRTK
jgi:hypothetical protein